MKRIDVNKLVQNQDFTERLEEFLAAFVHIFHEDWEYASRCLEVGYFINHTFLEPDVDDVSSNWFARGRLLLAFRKLIES